MKNLAGVKDADITIKEELYLAGIPIVKTERSTGEVGYSFVGKIGVWTFTRAWYYWVVRPDKDSNGLSLDIAMELHNRKHPVKDEILGDTVRSGGHAGGISPDDYVSQPVYNDELDLKLEALGYKKEYSDLIKRDYIPINYGEVAELCKTGKLVVDRFVDCYHIDEQIGLNEFAKLIKSL